MSPRSVLTLAAAAMLCATAVQAPAQDSDQREAQAKTAQIITIAKLVPLLCPGIEVDDSAIHALEEHAEVSERDVMDPNVFGVQDELIARSFAQSVKDNALQSCADVLNYLGPDGGKLLRLKRDAPG